jgi:glutamate--cysteine ligase
VEYVEVRLMDLDPFVPVGITAPTMRVLDVFLLHCLLGDSPPDTPQEIAAIARNQELVATRGREPGLLLARGAQQLALAEWGGQLLAACVPIAEALDAANGDGAYREALAEAAGSLGNPASTPSARVLEAMAREHDNSYTRFVLDRSAQHASALRALPLAAEAATRFAHLARDSLEEQRETEAADTLPFEAWRREYLSQERLRA